MAGNVSTQSLAVTIRVLMDENLTGKDKLKLMVKEMKVGFCNGALLGILALVCLGVYIALFLRPCVWNGDGNIGLRRRVASGCDCYFKPDRNTGADAFP